MAVLTISQLLTQAFNGAQTLIDRAENAGVRAEIEAGIQIRQVIEAALVAHSTILTQTMDRVNQTERETIEGISNLVGQALSGQREVINTLGVQALRFGNALPGSNTRPQLVSSSPRYVIGNCQNINFRCMGNFFHAATPGYQARLVCNGQNFTPTSNSTVMLEFNVPANAIFPRNVLQAADRITYINDLVLNVPHPVGILVNSVENAQFHITIGALPLSPGRATLQWNESSTRRTTQPLESSQFTLQATDTNDKEDTFSLHPTPGWTIQQGTSSCSIISQGGEGGYPPTPVYDTAGNVTYRVKVKGRRPNMATFSPLVNVMDALLNQSQPGSMTFTISCTQYKDEPITIPHGPDPIQLDWNSRVVIPHPIGTWRVKFWPFDGTGGTNGIEFTGVDSRNYLRIVNHGGQYMIESVPPIQ